MLTEEEGIANGLHTIAAFVAAAGPGPSLRSGPRTDEAASQGRAEV